MRARLHRPLADVQGIGDLRLAPLGEIPQQQYVALPRRLTASQVVALAEGYGPDWAELRFAGKMAELTLRLAKDDVPIQGRILDLQGKPVADAMVRDGRPWSPPLLAEGAKNA